MLREFAREQLLNASPGIIAGGAPVGVGAFPEEGVRGVGVDDELVADVGGGERVFELAALVGSDQLVLVADEEQQTAVVLGDAGGQGDRRPGWLSGMSGMGIQPP